MDYLNEIIILPFQPENQTEVKNLILAGLTEHWGNIDPNKNPDLDDISSTYAQATFLVAWLDHKIVGTGALVPRSDGIAEIVRMSVAANKRRQGIGRLILQQLIEHAHAAGYRQVILETTATWHEVIQFYQQFGFRVTYYCGGDVYFALDVPGPKFEKQNRP